MIKAYNLGRRWAPSDENGEPIKAKLVRNKPARRALRLAMRLQKSRIAVKLFRLQLDDLEVAALATNSHQRQRAIAQDRKERRHGRAG